VYVADTGNNVVRIFGKGGTIATVAGNGTAGYSGDANPASNIAGLATSAELKAPEGVAVDFGGNVYIADTGNAVVRVLATSTNDIMTYAGVNGSSFNGGDGGVATAATLAAPSDVAEDAAGDLFVAAGGEVRLVNAAGTINTVAGSSGTGVYKGEGGEANAAVIPAPATNLALDGAGNLFIFDTAGNRVLKVALATPALANFGTQGPGTTGTAQTFLVQNSGNSLLTLSNVTVTPASYVQSTGTTACITGTMLNAGQSCPITVVFSPSSSTTGTVTGSVSITDNTLNSAGATQTIALTGLSKTIYTTTLTVTVSPTTAVYGVAAETFTATLANGSTPMGSITFAVTGGQTQVIPLNGTTQAVFTINSPPAGTIMVTASFPGDTNNTSSSGTASVTVLPAVLTVAATSFTIHVGESLPAPVYTITGYVNGDTSSVVSGAPTETTTATATSPAGTYPTTLLIGTLAATNYTFNLVNGTVVVLPAVPADFTITATPSPLNVKRGSVGTATITLTPLYRYAETIALSCSTTTANVSCSVTPTTVTTNNLLGAVTAQLSITTYSLTSSVRSRITGSSVLFALGVPLGLLGLLTAGSKRKKLAGKLLALLFLTSGVLGMTSCTGNVISTPVATAGAYTVNITATDTSSKSTHTLPLTVNITTFDTP
jgi:hypothetical protein